MPFAGGIMQHGFQCGMLWGAALAAGAEAYQRYGPGPQAEAGAIAASEKLVESFQIRNKNKINCLEITALDLREPKGIFKFLVKGGPVGCFRMAAGYAQEAFEAINTTLDQSSFDVPDSPVSCTAVLAQKMGASDEQTVMAAGLAGGIGLCGGACGALGTAIWITAMRNGLQDSDQVDYMSPEGLAVIDRFVESSGYEFECAAIVGRRFTDNGDHAAYLRGGGCTQIIAALAGNPAA